MRWVLVALACFGPACSVGPRSTSNDAKKVTVSEMDVGRGVGADKRIDRPAESFFPEDPIYVSVATRGKGKVSLTARFVLGDGTLAHDDTQHIVPDGPAVSEFHVMNPAGWPVGTHRVEILVDGRSEGSRTFTVKAHAPAP
jgi:hypothetical protein